MELYWSVVNMRIDSFLLTAILEAFSVCGCTHNCDGPAEGCPCDPVKDRPFCDGWSDPSVGYSCVSGQWSTGPDGPCMPIWDGGRTIDLAMSSDVGTPDRMMTVIDSATAIDGQALDESPSSQ